MDTRSYRIVLVMFLIALVLTACAQLASRELTPVEVQATATAIVTRQHVDAERAEFGLTMWKVWQVTFIAGIWVTFFIGLRLALNHGLVKIEKPSIRFDPPPMRETTPPPMPAPKPMSDGLHGNLREVEVNDAPWLADAIDERVAGDD